MDFMSFLRKNSQGVTTLPSHSGSTGSNWDALRNSDFSFDPNSLKYAKQKDSSTSSIGSENDGMIVQTQEEIRKIMTPKRWSEEEDSRLRSLVSQFGARRWAKIGQLMASRGGKQCRERWKNHLNPSIKRTAWTPEEEEIIVEMHKRDGSRWSKMSLVLEGRTENAIKNYWNSTKRKIECKGSFDIASPLQCYISTMVASSSGVAPFPTRGKNSIAHENEEASDAVIVENNSGFDLNLPAESDFDFDLNEPASSR